ncbi:MAG: hypothetical protein QOJ15_9919, partial [Bradyrhizobium sp.]|nr:hypothetical protein [Bradyrhizobium sp.]
PPLDPVIRMRAVISGKSKCSAGNDWRKSLCVDAKSRKALRARAFAAKSENKRAGNEGAAGYKDTIAHRRKS